MQARVLIVEDEMIVAANLEAVLDDLGLAIIGIAADTKGALQMAARGADIALVDLNLRDGLTGPEIGRKLSNEHGITVLFMTANPRIVANGVEGVIGVVSKPVDDTLIQPIVQFAMKKRAGDPEARPPRGVHVFEGATG